MPRDVAVARPRAEEVQASAHERDFVEPTFRQFTSANDPTPRTHLLSNGRYTVMLTTAGSGYSRYAGLGITRWREDVTRDHWGTYLFLGHQSGAVWSAGISLPASSRMSIARPSEDRAELYRRDGHDHARVLVSPEDAELRRVSVMNLGGQTREIELTSYAEIVLAPPSADTAHQAFPVSSSRREAMISAPARDRRARSATDAAIWAAHIVVAEGQSGGGASIRAAGGSRPGAGSYAMSVIDGGLSGDGFGVDPSSASGGESAFAGRAHASSSPRSSFVARSAVALATSIATPRRSSGRSRSPGHGRRFSLNHLGRRMRPACSRSWGRILYADAMLGPAVLRQNAFGPRALWAHGISGDSIVLVRIDEPEDRASSAASPRARILAPEGAGSRSRHSERAGALLHGGAPGVAGDTGPDQPVGIASRAARDTREGLHPAERPSQGARARCPADRRASHPPESTRHARGATLARHGQSGAGRPAPPTPGQSPVTDRRAARPEFEFFNGLGGFVDGGRE